MMFICITIMNIIFKDFANYKIHFINDQKITLIMEYRTRHGYLDS